MQITITAFALFGIVCFLGGLLIGLTVNYSTLITGVLG